MNRTLVFILCSFFCFPVFGTEQIDDVLSIGGKSYDIDELPLNKLYEYDELSEIIKQKMCSASWRGYKASWYLKEGVLWLHSILKNPCHDGFEYIDADVLFRDMEYPIRAEWFNGSISLPVGDIQYIYEKSGEDLIGYNIEVFSFNFKNGELTSKGVETRKVRYEKP